jgi:hypothetical protein
MSVTVPPVAITPDGAMELAILKKANGKKIGIYFILIVLVMS